MPVTIEEKENGRLMEIHVSGKLEHKDYERFVPEFDRLVKQHGKVRLLFEMKDFHGWELQAAWDDLKLGLKHFSDIEQIAMVGDQKWQEWMARFCRPFTRAKVRYFEGNAIEEARGWLKNG